MAASGDREPGRSGRAPVLSGLCARGMWRCAPNTTSPCSTSGSWPTRSRCTAPRSPHDPTPAKPVMTSPAAVEGDVAVTGVAATVAGDRGHHVVAVPTSVAAVLPRSGHRAVAGRPATAASATRWVLDPDDDHGCVRALLALHDLGGGVVVCPAAPGSPWSLLAGHVLVALGKDRRALDAAGRRRRVPELLSLWLRAEQVQHLVVLRAHLLPTGDSRRARPVRHPCRCHGLGRRPRRRPLRPPLAECGTHALDGRGRPAHRRDGRRQPGDGHRARAVRDSARPRPPRRAQLAALHRAHPDPAARRPARLHARCPAAEPHHRRVERRENDGARAPQERQCCRDRRAGATHWRRGARPAGCRDRSGCRGALRADLLSDCGSWSCQ